VLSVEEEQLWVDLRPYANPSIYYVTEDSSVVKVRTEWVDLQHRRCRTQPYHQYCRNKRSARGLHRRDATVVFVLCDKRCTGSSGDWAFATSWCWTSRGTSLVSSPGEC
jgi:hypothetical protein